MVMIFRYLDVYMAIADHGLKNLRNSRSLGGRVEASTLYPERAEAASCCEDYYGHIRKKRAVIMQN